MTKYQMLMTMAHSPVRNYIIPGLTSWLIGSPHKNGRVRLFYNERNHSETVIPHSHRYPLYCEVLEGHVTNTIWARSKVKNDANDFYRISKIFPEDGFGKYRVEFFDTGWFYSVEQKYYKEQTYHLEAATIHSIKFSKGAAVLIFEGEQESESSSIIEPISDNVAIPTFKVEDWMFK